MVKVRKCALPITLTHTPKSEHAILALHGYGGYPGELALPAKVLFEAGYDLFVIRHPGHGTNGEDFSTTNRKMWCDNARDTIKTLQKTYSKISLIGHSMGGALALILGTEFSISKMVLYAPALIVNRLNLPLLRITSLFVKKRKIAWQSDPRYHFFDERDSDDDQFLGEQYWSTLHMKQLVELGLLVKEAQRALRKNSSDILVFTGELDTQVPKEVGQQIIEIGEGRNNWLHLERATHLIPYDIDEESRTRAMKKTVEWFTLD